MLCMELEVPLFMVLARVELILPFSRLSVMLKIIYYFCKLSASEASLTGFAIQIGVTGLPSQKKSTTMRCEGSVEPD